MKRYLVIFICSIVFALAALFSFFYCYFHGPQGHEVISVIVMLVFFLSAVIIHGLIQGTKRIRETYFSFKNSECANRYVLDLSEEQLGFFIDSLSKEELKIELNQARERHGKILHEEYESQCQHDMRLRDAERLLKQLKASI